jgi:Arc/MetJ family transcription regulator
MKLRTNIVLDDALVARDQELTEIRTKREVINIVLRPLESLHEQSSIRALCGKLHGERDLVELRQGRSYAGG